MLAEKLDDPFRREVSKPHKGNNKRNLKHAHSQELHSRAEMKRVHCSAVTSRASVGIMLPTALDLKKLL